MLLPTAHRTRHGTSLMEVSVVVIILGVLLSTLWVTYGAVTNSSEKEAAKHTLRTIMVAQQLRYGTRGSFTDSPADLTDLEPSLTYLGGGTAAAGTNEVSVQTGRHRDSPAVAVATATPTRCYGAVVYPPSLRDPETASWDPAVSACNGAKAFDHAGEGRW